MTWMEYCGLCRTVSEGTLEPYSLACNVTSTLTRLYRNNLLGGFKRRYYQLLHDMECVPPLDYEKRDNYYLAVLEDACRLLEDAAARHGYVFETEEGDGASYVLRPTEKRMPIVRRFYG